MDDSELETVNLSSEDTCFERTRKILRVAGIEDRMGLSYRMAEAIDAYRRIDRQSVEAQLCATEDLDSEG